MYSFLTSRSSALTRAASSWYGIVSAQPAPPLWPYTQLTASYPAASFGIPVDATASGLKPFTPAGLEKRQDACTLDLSETDSGSSNTAAEPEASLTDLTTDAPITASEDVLVTTVSEKLPPADTPADFPPTTTLAEPPPPSDTAVTVTLAIYKDGDCTDLIDEFDVDLDTNCATHLKDNGDAQKFKCFIVKVVSPGASDQQVQLTVYKDGHCPSGNDDNREVYTDLNAIIDKGQTPFKMGSLILNAGGS